MEGECFVGGCLCLRITKGVTHVIMATIRIINVGYLGSIQVIAGYFWSCRVISVFSTTA